MIKKKTSRSRAATKTIYLQMHQFFTRHNSCKLNERRYFILLTHQRNRTNKNNQRTRMFISRYHCLHSTLRYQNHFDNVSLALKSEIIAKRCKINKWIFFFASVNKTTSLWRYRNYSRYGIFISSKYIFISIPPLELEEFYLRLIPIPFCG